MFVKRDSQSPGSDRGRGDGVHCDLCGSSNPAVRCDKCNGHAFCLSCDDMYHRHPKRKQHLRKAIDSYTSAVPAAVIRPPSGQRPNVPGDPSKMPIPPPRKKKGKSFFPGFGGEIPALPKKEFSITEKLGSIRRFMSNRPLPPIPKHELPLQQGGIPPKPRAASPKNPQIIDNRQVQNNRSRTNRPQVPEREGSPEYQNILAHLTKVAQNSADEWEDEPSVSTSGSTRGSSVGEDIGWGQDVTSLSKSGAPPQLSNKSDDMRNPALEDWQGLGTLRRTQMQPGFIPPEGLQSRMTHSTSVGNLQSGYPNQQLPSPGFFPGPYANYFAQGGMPGAPYPSAFPNYLGQFPRGSWSHMHNRGDGEEEDEEELANQDFNDATLTKSSKSEMKRSQSVMHDPMMAPPGAFFPFGVMPPGYPGSGYFPPGYAPYWAPQPGQRLSTPSSPVQSIRSLNRKTRGRSRKHHRDDESVSSDKSRDDSSRRGSRSNRRSEESSEREPESEDEDLEESSDKRRSRSKESTQDEESKPKEDDFVVPPEIAEDKPPAPPPPIPTDLWECTFCTFINQPGGRVCGVCCKTISSTTGKEKSDSGDSKGTTSPAEPKAGKDELKELKDKKKKAKEEFLNFSPEFLEEQQKLEEEIRKRLERNRRLSEGFPGEPTSRRNSVTETTVLPPEEESSPINASSPSPTQQTQLSPSSFKSATVAQSPSPASPEPVVKVDSVTSTEDNTAYSQIISNTAVENITSDKIQVPEPTTKTDSSCQTNVEDSHSPQPHRHGHSIGQGTDNISDFSQEDSLNNPVVNKVEMGTSPPRLTKEFSQNLFDRSGHFSNLERSVSQSSLKDEMLYSGRQYPNERREDYNRGQLLRSLSRVSLVSEPGMYGLQEQILRQPESPFMQRKNLGSDWRKRRPSDSSTRDYIPQPQFQGGWYPRERNNYPSMEDLLERRRQETMRAQGMEMVRLIRKAEQSGFLPDDLQVALNHCAQDQDPIDWLEDNWTNMIETVVTMATNYGHDKPDNDVGIVSAGEAKEALRIHRGNIWASVTECVESRQRKFLELRDRGNFTRREIVAALTANQGNLELAYSEITRSLHKPFSLNVWGPGSGMENLESARLSPSDMIQGKGFSDRSNEQLEQPRTPYLQHRKQHLGENTNIHRSMLNLNLIGLEDDFKPLNANSGVSPKLTRRFSFTSGRTSDFAGFSPNFNRMNPSKGYDASDSMSVTSEDLETFDSPFKKQTAKERLPRESGRGNKSRKSRSTTFLNKLASLRKSKAKPETDSKGEFKIELDSDFSEADAHLRNKGKSMSVQQINKSGRDERPQRRSFLQRIMRGSSPDLSTKVESGFINYTQDDLMVNNQLQARDLRGAVEFSSEEKVQAFLDKMTEEPLPKPEQKMGFLQRLGLRSNKKESGRSSSSASEAQPSTSPPPENVIANKGNAVLSDAVVMQGAAAENYTDNSLTNITQKVSLGNEPETRKVEEAEKLISNESARSRFFESFLTDSAGKPLEDNTKSVPQDIIKDNIASALIVETSHDRNKDASNSSPKLSPVINSNLKTENSIRSNNLLSKKMETSPISKSSEKMDGPVAEPQREENKDTKETSKSEDKAKIKAVPEATRSISSSKDNEKKKKPKTTVAQGKSETLKQENAQEERIIRREVKEELIEEREKPNDDKNQTDKRATSKPGIVQTKLEIVETIVEIVKPREEKGKQTKTSTISIDSKPKDENVTTVAENKDKARKDPTLDKEVKPKSDEIAVSESPRTSGEAHKSAKDIAYPVSRFAKPREPLFSFKDKTKKEDESKASQIKEAAIKNDSLPLASEKPQVLSNELSASATAQPLKSILKKADESKTEKNLDLSARKVSPPPTEEKLEEDYSTVPTSPSTALPLKSILKKTSTSEQPTVDQKSPEPRPRTQSTSTHSSNDERNSTPETLKKADLYTAKTFTESQKLRSSSNVTRENEERSISPEMITNLIGSPKSPTRHEAIDKKTAPNGDIAQSILPSSSILSTSTKNEEKVSSTPLSEIKTCEMVEVANDLSTSASTSEEASAAPARRRRRQSDAEDISLQAPQPTSSLRRRRSMSMEKTAPIYRTRERKMDIAQIDTSDVTDLDLAIEDSTASTATKDDLTKDEKIDESIDAKANDQKLSAPRVRRQRSISRDRLSRTPSVTDSREGLVGSTTDILRIAKPAAVGRQDSLRERRRSTSFDVMKGRFADNNALAKAAKTLDATDNTENEVTPSQPKSESALAKTKPKTETALAKTKPKADTKGKGGPAAKQIDVSAPAMSSKRLVLDTLIKELLAEGKCESYEQAETAARLMEMNFDEDEALEASKECGTLYQAISFLSQDCELCAGKFPVADMVSMVNCTHRACRDCLKAYFTIQIRDRNIMELICPFCNEPDLTNDDIASDYFNNMDLLLKNLLDMEIHELFHRKLRDRALMKDPLFRWCSQCSSGFIITNPNQKRLLCPDCKAVTCASCRKRWEKQHEGLTCDKYLAWKEANDPEIQAAGLAQHLAENGIDCPNCHFRYSLAKGGCMHFRCGQCQFDFCSGCGKPFKMGQKCGVSDFCSKLGLHAHHPRNCLFYLRDKEPADLQKLLDQFNVSYNTERPDGMEVKVRCQVMEQKESQDGLKDDICGKDVMDGFAGLCRLHYIEYLSGLIKRTNLDPINMFNEDELELCLKRATMKLPPKYYGTPSAVYRDLLLKFLVALINKNMVDPMTLMDVQDLQVVLQRGHQAVPEYEIRESEEQYRQRLIETIKEKLPLEKIEGTF